MGISDIFPEGPPPPELTDWDAEYSRRGLELRQKLKPVPLESWHKLGRVGRAAFHAAADPGVSINTAQDAAEHAESERVRQVLNGTYYLD